MNKIIPVIGILGLGVALTGCANNLTNVQAKQEEVNLNSNTKDIKVPGMSNYSLELESDEIATLEELNEDVEIPENDSEEPETNNNEISTLYSLSTDIENSCDDFCELKSEISEAITETENLIAKINNKEMELSKEQRLHLSEQAMQLKNLGRQLSNVTTELSLNLSDIYQIINENNAQNSNLSLKYLIVLDNLINGNEMLQSGLNSLNMINYMLNNNANGNIYYRHQENNNPPVEKNYTINNGEITETENTTIDTLNSNPESNIDTYHSNMPNNIDSFFNTALFDNEFMYGNNGYGYGMNPYIMQYGQYENNKNNQSNSVNKTQQTQDIEETKQETPKETKKKKFKLQKNIDTYRDEKTPDLKTKINNFKESISGFFNKIQPTKDIITKPIYRF